VKNERRHSDELPTVDTEDEEDDLPITERERNLEGLTSAFDLALFREAQAQASEVSLKFFCFNDIFLNPETKFFF
jgi:hypothetical protein